MRAKLGLMVLCAVALLSLHSVLAVAAQLGPAVGKA